MAFFHSLAARRVQRAWRACAARRLVAAGGALRALATCAVCQDECVRLVRCANGHGCCVGCALCASDMRCPLCREPRPLVAERVLADTMAACGLRLRCASCGVSSAIADVEAHRAWCPAHRYVCPHAACAQCVSAGAMAAHVAAHHSDGVPRLLRAADGARHVVAAFALRLASDSLVLEVGGAVVVVRTWPKYLSALALSEAGPPALQLAARAYYPAPTARALCLTVRLLRVVGCETPEAFCEEHRLGVVPPMLASRESCVMCNVAATLVPRTVYAPPPQHPRLPDVNPFCVVPARPGAGLAARARHAGLRDLPAVQLPLAPATATPVAFVHLALREDVRVAIGDLYRE